VKHRDLIRRAFAILLIGELVFAPLAVAAAGTPAVEAGDVQLHANHAAMHVMPGVIDEMPCHQSKPDKACPFMAICLMLCCQGLPVAQALVPALSLTASPMLPPALAPPDGLTSPPPSRPPKA